METRFGTFCLFCTFIKSNHLSVIQISVFSVSINVKRLKTIYSLYREDIIFPVTLKMLDIHLI